MRQSQLPLWGLVLALLFGVRSALPGYQSSSHQLSLPAAKASSKAPGAQAPSALPPIWADALCKLNPTFGSSRYTLEQTKMQSKDKDKDPACLGSDVLRRLKLTAMVAAVPDPIHTHLGLSFDRTIDAIQAAAAEVSFFPYVNALPWPPPHAEQVSSQSEASSQYEYPGILLFRKARAKSVSARETDVLDEYLAVFLVPELPSSGMDQLTFLSAVRIMNKIAPDSLHPLLLLGPNFSGSVPLLPSLEAAITAELTADTKPQPRALNAQPTACIKAVSGSVTNAENPFTDDNSAPCGSSFRSLQTSDGNAIQFLARRLQASNGYCPGDIAILSEEGTKYGNLSEAPAVSSTASRSTACTQRDKLIYLHFPREIAKLRNASVALLSAPGQKDQGSSAKTDVLPLNWQDAHPFVKDDVRNYGEQTAVSEETVLASLASLIRSQGIKTLGIFATDPMDTAFLIHSFRQSSPDVRIFIRDPDLLYLRTPDVGSLNGILAINNFPLIPQNQFWSKPDSGAPRHLVSFPSAGQEAVYNASLALLGPKLAHAQPQNEKQYLLDGEWPGGIQPASKDSQPLWLAVTGTAGYYPLGILNAPAAEDETASLALLAVGRPPYATVVVSLLIGLAGLLHAWWATFPRTAPSRFTAEFNLANKADPISVTKGFCHALALMSLAFCVLLITSSFYFFRNTPYKLGFGSHTSFPIYLIAGISGRTLVLVLLIAAGWRLLDSVLLPAFSRGPASDTSNNLLHIRTIAWTAPVAIAIFIAPIIAWIANTSAPTFQNAFMHYRDLYLGSGVAPVLPALLLAVIAYLGVITYLRRVAYWEYGSVPTPSMNLDEVFSGDFTQPMQCIDRWLLGIPAMSPRRVTAFAALFAISVLALRPWATMDAIDPQWVHRFLVAGFTFAFFVMSINWIRFLAIWRQLRQLLRGLEKLPLRVAFNRLPRESSLPIWSWSVHDGTYLPIVQAMETLRALTRADPTLLSKKTEEELRSGIAALENPAHADQRAGVSCEERKGVMHATRRAMTAAIRELSSVLIREYWNRGSIAPHSGVPTGDPSDRKYVLAEDFVALRFYAYIRYVVSELRNLLFFLALSFSLLFLSLHVYCFRADQGIDFCFIVLLLAMGGGIIWVLLEMERDALLSRLEGTEAGVLGKNFYFNLIKYGVVPLATVLGSQIPSVSNFLLTKLQPALEAFR
jgi:hypothetical protein